MTASIKRLKIFGIHDIQDVDIPFETPISIFMGPNGVGKSTVLNIFVHILSRQWQRLAKQPFLSATIEFDSGDEVTVSRADCVDLISAELPIRIQQMANTLADADMLSHLLREDIQNEVQGEAIEAQTGLTPRDIRTVRNYMTQYSGSVRSITALSTATKIIRENFNYKILYLPTYRRIEQEIGDVLALAPSSMRRIQAEIADSLNHSNAMG